MGNTELSEKPKVKEYREKLNNINNLPTLPSIATQILKIANQNEAEVSQIIPIMEKDPPLAMKVLKIANSAYYGMRREIKSLRQAIVVIGLDELTNITLSFSVLKEITPANGDTGVNWKRFWKHCIFTGFVNEMIINELGVRNIDTPYLSGLLHDIGKLILYIIEEDNYTNILSQAREEGVRLHKMEKRELGISHPEIGRLIAEKWNLSRSDKDIIGSHHKNCEDLEQEDIQAILSIKVSNGIANYLGMDFVDVNNESEIKEEKCWDLLVEKKEYEEISFEEMVEKFSERFESIEEMVELIQT